MANETTSVTFGEQQLEALIDQAVVDCDHRSEQALGLFIAIEENVRVPFRALDFDEDVAVVGFELDDMCVEAICERDGEEEAIPLFDLTLVAPLPQGAEWIAAYCLWARHAGVEDADDAIDDDEDES